MPFVNIKTPEAALTPAQKTDIAHRVTEWNSSCRSYMFRWVSISSKR